MKRFKNTPDPIPSLLKNEVFVFGANQLGMHIGGSAKAASINYGAVMGEIHRTGRCYGIVTIYFETVNPMTFSELEKEFELFFKQVELEKEKEFLLTKVGLGIAGWELTDILACFNKFYNPKIHTNITIPIEFENA